MTRPVAATVVLYIAEDSEAVFQTLDSILRQTVKRITLKIVIACPLKKETARRLQAYVKRDFRVQLCDASEPAAQKAEEPVFYIHPGETFALDWLDNRIYGIPGEVKEPEIVPPEVSIVIPVESGCTALQQCMESIFQCSDVPYEVILVDSSSGEKDEGLFAIYSQMNNVRILRGTDAESFDECVRKGLSATDLDAVILKNTAVVTPCWLSCLRRGAYSGEKPALAAPLSNTGRFAVKSGLPLGRTAEILRGVSRREYPAVSAGENFCIFVPREYVSALTGSSSSASFPGVLCDDAYVFCTEQEAAAGRETGSASELLACAEKELENAGTGKTDAAGESRSALARPVFPEGTGLRSVSVIVCIHNALKDVTECLNSLLENRSFPYDILLVDDGSGEETAAFLRKFAARTGCMLLRHETSLGYTVSANEGLRAARGDYCVLLNSDTIVTDSWVEKMLCCFLQNEKTGIVGPLSNSATFQSVPFLYDPDRIEGCPNRLSEGMTMQSMAACVQQCADRKYPEIAVVHGFCMMIDRRVMNAVGLLNEEVFPRGYGEEVDYCLRAREAGFELRVADDAYVYHERNRSFSGNVRNVLNEKAKNLLAELHGKDYNEALRRLERNPALTSARENVETALPIFRNKMLKLRGKKIGFFLPVAGGSGGANSVCQEVAGMRRLGADVWIVSDTKHRERFLANYPEAEAYTLFADVGSEISVERACCHFDVLVATLFTTVKTIRRIAARYPHMKTAYYIQDYEPYFFPEEDERYSEAFASYTAVPGMLLFAKTDWICAEVEKYHDVKVRRVEPGLDISVYNPYLLREKKENEALQICAMLRPQTPRRNAGGTVEVLFALKKKYGGQIVIKVFGCGDAECEQLLAAAGAESGILTNLGVLKRQEAASLLAESDIFVDMSTYQAFGRTGLESMSLGCVPLLPERGGAESFAVDGENALLADTDRPEEAAERISALIEDRALLKKLRLAGLQTAGEYDVTKAAWSELELFSELFQ